MTRIEQFFWPAPRRLLAGAALALLTLHGPNAAAASGAAALVVADGDYAGKPVMPNCVQAARAVSDRLHQQGFAVVEAIDGPAVGLRDALGDFAARVAASHAPALVYVCAAATAVDKRLFVLPGDVDLQKPLRPETQGVVLRALLNAMAGTKGTMVAELGLPPGTPAAPILAATQERLPDGLHLAMTLGEGNQTGALGNRLAGDGTPLDQGWDRLAAVLQGAPEAGATTVSLYDPPPAPSPESPAPAAAGPAAGGSGPIALAPQPAAAPAPAQQAAAPTAPAAPDAAAPETPDAAKQTPPTKSARQRPAPDERLRRVEAALAKRKFYSGPLDGVLDARLVQAITSYQLSIGDQPTGTLTQTEIVRLLNNW